MMNLPLWKRFIASILDKVCILVLWFVLLNYVAYTPYTAAGKLGTYSYLVTISPSNYEYIDIGSKNRQGASENNYGVSEWYRALQELDLASMKQETTKDVDITITFWFILANLIYFLLGELLCGASFFKSLFGGVVVDDDGCKLEKNRYLVRNIAFVIILTACVLLHFLLNISYLFVVVVFFIVFEFSLFKNRQNLLDKLFDCYLVTKKSLNGEVGDTNRVTTNQQKEIVSVVNSKLVKTIAEVSEKVSLIDEPKSKITPQTDVVDSLNLDAVNSLEVIKQNITKKETQCPPKHKFISKLLLIMIVILSFFCVHQLLNYFLGDYFNTDNYSANTQTKNLQRKHQLSRNLITYDAERILSSEQLGDTVSSQQWLDNDLGNLPSGKYISSYYGTRSDYYYAGNRKVTRYYSERVPRYRTVDYGYGFKERYQDGWDWKQVPYTDYEPVYKNYYWSYALSSFDISAQVSLFENEDSTYSKYLRNIEQQITANYDFKNHYTKVGGVKAFAYYTTNGLPIKRVIFCANKRAYILETKSTHDLDKHSGEIAGIINIKNYNINENDRNTLLTYFICFVICITILCVCFANHKKELIRNKYSNILSKIAILSACINCLIFAWQMYSLFTVYSVNFEAAIVLILSSFSVLLIDIPLFWYYSKKSAEDYKYDFIIPTFIKKYIYDKINNEVNKKIYLTFVGYPLMVVSLIPLGLVLLPYVILSLLVSTLAVYLSKWSAWLGGTHNTVSAENISLLNYYSILGISKDANVNDINIAYNAHMAKLNMSLNTPSFNSTYFSQVQEAFIILSDTENLRKLYDEELKCFETCASPAEYVITNSTLLEIIKKNRRNNNVPSKQVKNNDLLNKIFLIIVVLIFFIVAIVKCSSVSD